MLWIPGPTEVRPEILAECARPMIGHRSKAMSALIERIDPGLRLAFGLDAGSRAHVAVHTSSATGLMEASLAGAGERVLCCVNGAFSKRYFQIAELCGKRVAVLEFDWGRAVSADALRETLQERGPFDAVTIVSNETSTGACTDLARIGAVMREFEDTLLLVDLVSYLAGAPVDFDANRIDFGFAGVQKALALPPGISVACASERYMAAARESSGRGFYLDPVRIIEGHEERKTPSTPAISFYYALARQLEDITSGATLPSRERSRRGREAWNARFEKHARMRRRTLDWARARGLESFPPAAETSPTVACIRAGHVDVARLVAGLAERGLEISNGYGDLKGKTFRIGHMGDHTEEGLEQVLAAADEVLHAAAYGARLDLPHA